MNEDKTLPDLTLHEATVDIHNLKTRVDKHTSELSSLEYLFKLHLDHYRKDVSGMQKRIDSLEHGKTS
jgi:hypothetical protein